MSDPPESDPPELSLDRLLVFVKFCRYNSEPIRDYRRLAVRILLISFIPDILIGLQHWFGGGWPEALSLRPCTLWSGRSA